MVLLHTTTAENAHMHVRRHDNNSADRPHIVMNDYTPLLTSNSPSPRRAQRIRHGLSLSLLESLWN